MSALQCLLHMAPLHAHVYDGSSPPIPGAGYDALETSPGSGSFAALLPHPLWSDEVGREVSLEHAEVTAGSTR